MKQRNRSWLDRTVGRHNFGLRVQAQAGKRFRQGKISEEKKKAIIDNNRKRNMAMDAIISAEKHFGKIPPSQQRAIKELFRQPHGRTAAERLETFSAKFLPKLTKILGRGNLQKARMILDTYWYLYKEHVIVRKTIKPTK